MSEEKEAAVAEELTEWGEIDTSPSQAEEDKVEFEVDGRGQKQFVYLTSFDGKAIDKLKKDLMKTESG